MLDNIFTNINFFGQFLRSPAKIGSVCPSSRFLSRTLVHTALENATSQGLIVDLGAGSGVVSRELLRAGVSPKRILAVDISEKFIHVFNKNCPEIELRIADAKNLSEIVERYFPDLPVQAIISSLPLRTLPANAVAEILMEIWNILHKNNGVLIQYTYAVWLRSSLEIFGYFIMGRHYQIFNFPPALVEKYYPKI